MMYYMNSKDLQNIFLKHENDKDILEAQYVLISTRIRIRNTKTCKNVINCKNDLFPNPMICNADEEHFEDAYFEQLDNNKVLLAQLIKLSIEEKLNIFFVCTKKEDNLGYLQYLSNYIYIKFDYPVYRYKSYYSGKSGLYRYNKQGVLGICNSIIENGKNRNLDDIIDSGNIGKYAKQASKDELKTVLKSNGVYRKGMSKQEMIDVIESLY